jgi:hypothetical protein
MFEEILVLITELADDDAVLTSLEVVAFAFEVYELVLDHLRYRQESQ